MERVLQAIAGLLILIGLLWIGQGTGAFPYPSESFMIADTNWAWIGAVTAVVGAVLLVGVRRRR